MSGVVVIESNAGSLAGAALRGGDLVVKGQVGARTGIDQKGGTIIVMGDAGSMTGFMMQRGRQIILRRRGPRPRRLHVRRHDLRRRQGQGARDRLRARRVDRRRHRADRAQVLASTASATRPSSRSSCAARSSTTTTRSSRASGSWCSDGRPRRRERTQPEDRPRPLEDLHAGGHRRHPHEVGARSLPDARLLDVQEDPALGRADLPAGHAHPLRDRGLSREVRDEDRARRALRQEADRARHPDLHHRHELRRAQPRGEDGARQGRLAWPAPPPAPARAE